MVLKVTPSMMITTMPNYNFQQHFKEFQRQSYTVLVEILWRVVKMQHFEVGNYV